MKKQGLAFHCHHDQFVEFVYDYDERVEFIKSNKPQNEVELRLRLFKMIPEDMIPGKGSVIREDYDQARKTYSQACEDYDQARKTYSQACEDYDQARKTYSQAWEAYVQACEDYNQAWEVYLTSHKQEIDELHRQLCPNCPWNGKTIFPQNCNQSWG